jgi:DNA-binding beta-propeller fold protein YncE
MQSAALPVTAVWAAREGRVDDPLFRKGISLPAERNLTQLQAIAEYSRHSVALERLGKHELVVSLLAGSFTGFAGKKVHTTFLALEVESAVPRMPAVSREIKRISDFLVAELKLSSHPKSLYAEAVEKAVLLRPNERRLQPVRILGGAKGNGFDQFDAPDAVAFTLDGRLVAGDTDNARFKIYHLDEQSQTVQIVGREGSAPGEFSHSLAATIGKFKIYNQVQGITVDKRGLIYVIDQGNRRIQVFDSSGKVSPEKVIMLKHCPMEAPRCLDGLWRPTRKYDYTSIQGIAADGDGGIFVSDRGMSRVYRLLPGGELDPSFVVPEFNPVTGKRILNDPESMVVYQDKLFVANEGRSEIAVLDRKTGRITGPVVAFGEDVFAGKVEGLAVVRDYLLAVDVQNTRIAVFDLRNEKPKFLLAFVGDFVSADGIAVDPLGRYVAIADQGNLRVILYSLPEIVEHLAALKQ